MSDIEHGYRVVWGDITYDCQTWEEAFERFGELEREDEHCLGQIVPISNGVPGTAVLWPRVGDGFEALVIPPSPRCWPTYEWGQGVESSRAPARSSELRRVD